MSDNIDRKTVEGFGDEWRRFDQSALDPAESEKLFERYFRIFPWDALPPDAAGFDMGCGSGRWARIAAKRVGRLLCVDASEAALHVARRNLAGSANCTLALGTVDALPMANDSMDFGYAIGVLHHVPDTAAGLRCCVEKLKPGAPFLLYLYYSLDNRPWWFRAIWRVSNLFRLIVSRLPFRLRLPVTQIIASLVYYPLARLSLIMERLGLPVSGIPLSSYRHSSFFTMRTDTLDRFGTRLEQRFSRQQVVEMMERSGLERIVVSEAVPYWTAVGYRGA